MAYHKPPFRSIAITTHKLESALQLYLANKVKQLHYLLQTCTDGDFPDGTLFTTACSAYITNAT